MTVSFDRTSNRTKAGVYIPEQVHGTKITEIITGNESLLGSDGLCTKAESFCIGVVTADCAPICLADEQQVVVVHVGWQGLEAGIIEAALNLFIAEPKEVFVGPMMHTFEIQKDACYERLQDRFGEQFFFTVGDTLHFDFKAAVASQLPGHVIFDERNTFLDETLPSYRRNGTTDRLVTCVQRRV